jgi:ATP-dependent Clp protease ATP-binding subunit ClpA
MNEYKFTPQTESVFKDAKQLTLDLHRSSVDLDIFFHCFLSKLSLSCSHILEPYNVIDDLRLVSALEVRAKKPNKTASGKYSSKLKKLIENCSDLQKENFNADYISPEIIFMGMLDENFRPKAISKTFDEKEIDSLITDIVAFIQDIDLPKNNPEGDSEYEYETKQWVEMFDENPILNEFAENLNLKAARKEFDKIVDFDDKVAEIATILCRKKKPNAILVGPAGTGKTALVESLASKIVSGDVPELISDKVIYSLSLSSMVAGTQYRGQFEERLENFVNEVKKYDNIILFIDEIHTLVGAGGTAENSLEASNILKPELARGTISCIGATTINEYTNTIKKDSALDRRFEKVIVKQPSKLQVQQIIPIIISYYEDFHSVKYSEDFLENVIDYCEMYLPNKYYPDKLVDVIDHCGAQSKIDFWNLDPSIKEMRKDISSQDLTLESMQALVEMVSDKMSEWASNLQDATPIVSSDHLKHFFAKKQNPLSDSNFCSELKEDLNEKFVGHKDLMQNLFDSIIFSNFKLNKKVSSPNVYCLSGDKSSGKSFFCSILRESLDKNGFSVLFYDGTHFSDEYSKHKILPEFRQNNASLCEKVNIHPNSTIIIDDFHLIHNSAKTIFTQIFKEGKIQMQNGEICDFSNCKFFITSRLQKNKTMGFNTKSSHQKSIIPEDLRKLFDCDLQIEPLSNKDILQILDNRVSKMQKDLAIRDIKLICSSGFMKKFVKSLVNIVDFENKFNTEISKFIYKEITSNKKTINLDKIAESA